MPSRRAKKLLDFSPLRMLSSAVALNTHTLLCWGFDTWMEVNIQLHAVAALSQVKETGAGRYAEKKNRLFCLEWNPCHPVRSYLLECGEVVYKAWGLFTYVTRYPLLDVTNEI